jgi:uncharacterized protein
MPKHTHEIRDPIHVFVRLGTEERSVLDSRAFQRLRHIQQLALTSLIYPAATHKRFEHSLGVMELAGRVYDTVTHPEAIVSDQVREALPQLTQGETEKAYWRRALRMAALCHDIGHLPFSHAAEKELLPAGWSHERLSRILIESDEMRSIWGSMTPPLNPEHIVKIAIGKKNASDLTFSTWEAILSEIIIGDAFGVDRIDYLLRDSHHIGVAYGRFDHFRLIDTLRILPSPMSGEPLLGVLEGGIQSAEALLLARYLMYSQVYIHAVRRIYDIHLRDFLKTWLPGGFFPTNVGDHLRMTDNEVTSALLAAAFDSTQPTHRYARRIICRDHFRVLYRRHPDDVAINPEAGKAVFQKASEQFGEENVRFDSFRQGGGGPDFPVLSNDSRIVSSLSLSEALRHIPIVSADFVFIRRDLLEPSRRWLATNRSTIIQPESEVKG